MSLYLGLDTSNYTTSVALYDGQGAVRHFKQLLPVAAGEKGLRQSDAVFHHTRQLPDLLEQALQAAEQPLCAIGVSVRPTQQTDSYMPCFLVGQAAARSLAAALHIPMHTYSHQQGHVAAALLGSDSLSLRAAPFLAFHVSGGTTQALLVEPQGESICCTLVAESLDLKAGQLIDRVGLALGLAFPAGPALERLAASATRDFSPKPSMDGLNCHLSGVENQCAKLIAQGESAPNVALFCLRSVQAALEGMTGRLLERYGPLPLVYAGGVMSNTLLREHFQKRYGGRFAPPAFSADNAAGVAVLASLAK